MFSSHLRTLIWVNFLNSFVNCLCKLQNDFHHRCNNLSKPWLFFGRKYGFNDNGHEACHNNYFVVKFLNTSRNQNMCANHVKDFFCIEIWTLQVKSLCKTNVSYNQMPIQSTQSTCRSKSPPTPPPSHFLFSPSLDLA